MAQISTAPLLCGCTENIPPTSFPHPSSRGRSRHSACQKTYGQQRKERKKKRHGISFPLHCAPVPSRFRFPARAPCPPGAARTHLCRTCSSSVSGCSPCPSLAPVPRRTGQLSCARFCFQEDDVLLQHSVTSHAALWTDFSKLRVVLFCFAVTLPSLYQKYRTPQGIAAQTER